MFQEWPKIKLFVVWINHGTISCFCFQSMMGWWNAKHSCVCEMTPFHMADIEDVLKHVFANLHAMQTFCKCFVFATYKEWQGALQLQVLSWNHVQLEMHVCYGIAIPAASGFPSVTEHKFCHGFCHLLSLEQLKTGTMESSAIVFACKLL